jgi:hypothetical protein
MENGKSKVKSQKSKKVISMKKIFSVVLLVTIFGCVQSVEAQTRKKKSAKTSKSSSKRAATVTKPKNMLALLQGRWVSLDDDKSFLEVKGDKQISIYGKDVIDTSVINFYPEYPVKITDADPKRTGGEYMITSARDNDYFIYTVEALTSTRLTLMYLPRGNLLRYKKVQ